MSKPGGVVQVYTSAGRRMFPAMKLPAPAAIVSSDGAWRLLAVCRDGSLHVWDLHTLTSLLQASLQPLLASTPSGTAGTFAAPPSPSHVPDPSSPSLQQWSDQQVLAQVL